MIPNEQYRLCNCSFKVKFGNSNISTEDLFNPSKRKGCKGEILAQNLQRAGFEVVKCDKHSRVAFVILVLGRFEILDHCIHLPRNRYKVKLPSLLQLLHQSQLQQISAYWTLQRERVGFANRFECYRRRPKQTRESLHRNLWNFCRKGFKHLRKKITITLTSLQVKVVFKTESENVRPRTIELSSNKM